MKFPIKQNELSTTIFTYLKNNDCDIIDSSIDTRNNELKIICHKKHTSKLRKIFKECKIEVAIYKRIRGFRLISISGFENEKEQKKI